MTGGPTFDDIFTVMSAASVGELTARVAVPDPPDLTLPATRLAIALNVLLDDLALRAEQKDHATNELRQALDRIRGMVDSALDAVIGMDERGRVIEWSQQAEVLFGWSREEAVGRPLVGLIIPERYRDAHVAGLERFRRTGEGPVLGKRIELEAIARDGREFPVELAIAAVPTADGHVFSAFVRDITERRAAERRRLTLEALNEIAYAASKPLDRERLGRFVVTYARDLLSADGASLWWSDPRRGLSVIAATDGSGTPGGGLATAAAKAFEAAWPVVERSEIAVPLVLHGLPVGALALGAARPFDDPAEAVRTLEVLGAQVAPLLEVAHLHEELLIEQQRFVKAFERNPSGLTIARQSDRTIIEANAAFLEMVGYERDEVIGRRAPDVGFVDVGAMREVRAELDVTGIVRGREMHLRTKLGGVREVIASFELAELHGEAVIFGTALDVTERRAAERQRAALEERLRLSERLESMGKLAGGVAHDFNNLIGVILNYATVISEDVADRPQVREDVEEIRRAAQRAADLTRELLVFSRREPSRVELLDATAVATTMSRLLRRTLGEGIELAITGTSDPCLIRADRSQIERVIMNLVVNARDAMPGGGKLVISTANVELGDGEAQALQAGLAPGRYVRLGVADTGAGMSPETLARAFEPFFTTKPSGHGTGLGLATVHAIVSEAGGAVGISSELGKGTVVSVHLPAAAAGGGEPAAAFVRGDGACA